jgi:hypothetical protein
MWTLNADDPLIAERMPTSPHVHVVTSLEGALKALGQVNPRVRVQREPVGKQLTANAV